MSELGVVVLSRERMMSWTISLCLSWRFVLVVCCLIRSSAMTSMRYSDQRPSIRLAAHRAFVSPPKSPAFSPSRPWPPPTPRSPPPAPPAQEFAHPPSSPCPPKRTCPESFPPFLRRRDGLSSLLERRCGVLRRRRRDLTSGWIGDPRVRRDALLLKLLSLFVSSSSRAKRMRPVLRAGHPLS